MEKIDEQLNKLMLVEIPIGMHQSIMHKVNYKRVRPALFTIFSILAFNLIIITWHINSKLVDAEFGSMMQDFFASFRLSFYFISTVAGSFFEIISLSTFMLLVINLLGVIYIGNKIRISKYKIMFETI